MLFRLAYRDSEAGWEMLDTTNQYALAGSDECVRTGAFELRPANPCEGNVMPTCRLGSNVVKNLAYTIESGTLRRRQAVA
jgi:hypothetical protein